MRLSVYYASISNGFGDIKGLLAGNWISNSADQIVPRNTTTMELALVEHSSTSTLAQATFRGKVLLHHKYFRKYRP